MTVEDSVVLLHITLFYLSFQQQKCNRMTMELLLMFVCWAVPHMPLRQLWVLHGKSSPLRQLKTNNEQIDEPTLWLAIRPSYKQQMLLEGRYPNEHEHHTVQGNKKILLVNTATLVGIHRETKKIPKIVTVDVHNERKQFGHWFVAEGYRTLHRTIKLRR